MTQIDGSEPSDPSLPNRGFKAEGLNSGGNSFGRWEFEFGYCLLFGAWNFLQKKYSLDMDINMILFAVE
jgi:hypothetical protein